MEPSTARSKGNAVKHIRITDARMPPFCWQEKDVFRLVQGSFKKSEIATALAVYATLTYYASNRQSDSFQIRRQTLCDFVGRSGNIVDRYLNSFV